MVHASRRRVAARVLPLILGFWAACPPSLAFAETKRDFVSGPWSGYAMFDAGEGRFRGCSAAIEGRDDPVLLWTHWDDREHLEIKVRNPPWTVRAGEDFQVTLSVDDAWRTDAPARVLAAPGASRPVFLSILGADVEALPEAAAGGRTLTVERAGERPLSFSLSGADRMLESLERCRRRGTALQRKAGESDLKAEFIFIPQEDADAFARWADRLAILAHEAAALVRVGDPVRRAADRFARREVPAELANFGYRLNLEFARKTMDRLDPEFADLHVFQPASGDDALSGALRGMAAGFLERAKDTLSDTKALMAATSRGDMEAVDRLRFALAERSYLGYAGDNVYLLIRNLTRSNEQVEYHANEAAKSINRLNIELVNAALLMHPDALVGAMPALIAASRDHIRDARRWIGSGKALLADRLTDAANAAESPTAQTLRISGELLDEEAALTDRFEAVLSEAEAALRAGGPLPGALRARLVHGGARTASALLERRARLRFKLGIAD